MWLKVTSRVGSRRVAGVGSRVLALIGVKLKLAHSQEPGNGYVMVA